MKIGLLGGTFDPPHNGHLTLAEEALLQFKLDEIWFIPAGNPAFRNSQSNVTHSYKRMNMVNAAISGIEWASACDYEIVREGTHTAETLQQLKEEHPNYEFYLILGADELRDIEYWYDFKYLFENCTIIAAHRSDERHDDIFRTHAFDLMDRYDAKIMFLPFHNVISSTMVREKIRNKQSFRFYIPANTYDYIVKYGIYGVGKNGQVDT